MSSSDKTIDVDDNVLDLQEPDPVVAASSSSSQAQIENSGAVFANEDEYDAAYDAVVAAKKTVFQSIRQRREAMGSENGNVMPSRQQLAAGQDGVHHQIEAAGTDLIV